MRTLCLVVAAALTAAPCFAADPKPEQGTVDAVQSLAAEAARRPHSQTEDLYKFLHQALFGPGHAIPDRTVAVDYLRRELENLGPPLTTDTVCDTLGGDPTLVRVNLRPFVDRGFPTDELLEAFVTTANEVSGDPGQMALALDLVSRWLVTEGKTELSRSLQALGKRLSAEGYPAVHHSEAYARAYRPAYRVVSASAAARHGWCGGVPRR